ncbi:hypothetical protein SAURM35S_03864 [Streptomyces aurantiogriseus]
MTAPDTLPLRSGSYFPHWLLERRRRAEQALISVVATAYLLGVSTRRAEKLAESLSVTQLSKSQVSAMARHLDEQVAAFRNRPLDAGPYAFVWVDALIQKLREGGHIINVHALIAVGADADGQREILGLDVATVEDGAGWLAFPRSLIARGLSGDQLVISGAHAGLVDAIGEVLSRAEQTAVGRLPAGATDTRDGSVNRRAAHSLTVDSGFVPACSMRPGRPGGAGNRSPQTPAVGPVELHRYPSRLRRPPDASPWLPIG